MEHAKQEELKERTELEQAEQEKLIRETYECLKNTDIRTVDPSSVTDIRDIQVDLSLSVEQRLVSVIQQMNGNPFVYRCEDILVKITFEGTVPLQSVLEDILERNKSIILSL